MAIDILKNTFNTAFDHIDRKFALTDYATARKYVKNYTGKIISRKNYNTNLGPSFHKAVVNDTTDRKQKFAPYFPMHGKKFENAQKEVLKALDAYGIEYDPENLPKASI